MTQLDDLVDLALANPLAVLGAAAIGLVAIAFISAPKPDPYVAEQKTAPKPAPNTTKAPRPVQLQQASATSTSESDVSHVRNKTYSAVAAAPATTRTAQVPAKGQEKPSVVSAKRAEAPKVNATQATAKVADKPAMASVPQQPSGVSFSDDDDFLPVTGKARSSGGSASAARPVQKAAEVKPALKPSQPAAQSSKVGIGMEDYGEPAGAQGEDDGWVTVTSKKHRARQEDE